MHIVVAPLLLVVIGHYIAYVVMGGFAIAGIVFAYQWFRHDNNKSVAVGMLALYTLGCIMLAATVYANAELLTV